MTIEKYKPYNLYGTKRALEIIGDALPDNVEFIEVPDYYLGKDADVMFLIPKTELEVKIAPLHEQTFGQWILN